MPSGKNYSRDKDSEENTNVYDKYSPTGESEFSRESTIPYDQDEVLSERHYALTPLEDVGRKRYRSREPRSGPTHGDYRGIGPKGYHRADETIRDDVCEALYRHTGVDASSIEVSIADGVVLLQGSVRSKEEKRLAEDAIDHISGVKEVRNDLFVQERSPVPKASKYGLTNNITGLN